ncbi:MAG: hypothetical protein AAFR79_11690 [Pseudomonadota bacterium]
MDDFIPPAQLALARKLQANKRSPAAAAYRARSRATAARGRAAMASADDRGRFDETSDMDDPLLVDCLKMPFWP